VRDHQNVPVRIGSSELASPGKEWIFDVTRLHSAGSQLVAFGRYILYVEIEKDGLL
jgi:hypothetical protein